MRLLQTAANSLADDIYYSKAGSVGITIHMSAGNGSLVPEPFNASTNTYVIPLSTASQDDKLMAYTSLQKTGAVIPLTATAQK